MLLLHCTVLYHVLWLLYAVSSCKRLVVGSSHTEHVNHLQQCRIRDCELSPSHCHIKQRHSDDSRDLGSPARTWYSRQGLRTTIAQQTCLSRGFQTRPTLQQQLKTLSFEGTDAITHNFCSLASLGPWTRARPLLTASQLQLWLQHRKQQH